MLFTCALVLSCAGGKGGYMCEIWIVGTSWNEQQDTGWARINKEDTCGREPARGSFKTWNKAMMDVFARCFKKTAIQEYMYKIYDCKIVPEENCHELTAVYHPGLIMLPWLSVFVRPDFSNIDWCLFFCRLKINHDSHEFILKLGTVANIHMGNIQILHSQLSFVDHDRARYVSSSLCSKPKGNTNLDSIVRCFANDQLCTLSWWYSLSYPLIVSSGCL